MTKISQILQSRTFWTIVVMLAFNITTYIHPYVSQGVFDLVNGMLTLLAGYFHVNPSQNYAATNSK